ncbi:hypothetical protein H6P81_016374 [Aristolochia fimbriata]|uniref:Putative plant transposon protein domain-containing protein n=1 Tax=Aristolochia fimbriata TaxID=158543 RepID=A0AAV7E8T7_ARIFI|nr:hypothetical protein H6P81_016374 [Aristolochia fimbriata]
MKTRRGELCCVRSESSNASQTEKKGIFTLQEETPCSAKHYKVWKSEVPQGQYQNFKRKVTYDATKFLDQHAQDRYAARFGQWLFSTPKYAIELVREFYSNPPDEEPRSKVFVRGKWVTYPAQKVNDCLKLPAISDKDFWDLQDKTFEELATPLCMERTVFNNGLARKSSMKTQASIWALFFLAMLVPNKHHSTITKEKIEVIYAFLNGMSINVGDVITSTIKETKNTGTPISRTHHSALPISRSLGKDDKLENCMMKQRQQPPQPTAGASSSRAAQEHRERQPAKTVAKLQEQLEQFQTSMEARFEHLKAFQLSFARGLAKHLGMPSEPIPTYPEEGDIEAEEEVGNEEVREAAHEEAMDEDSEQTASEQGRDDDEKEGEEGESGEEEEEEEGSEEEGESGEEEEEEEESGEEEESREESGEEGDEWDRVFYLLLNCNDYPCHVFLASP